MTGCRISPLLRERVLYLGQEVCLENASELLREVMGVEITDTTIHREIEQYGQQAESWIEENVTSVQPITLQQNEVVYCEADASMILTRESGWKEVKLGRIFRSDSIRDSRSEGNKIEGSEYVGRLGHFEDFTRQMDQVLQKHKAHGPRLVFVSDGALWIKNWVSENYPEATQILNYYHAVEHLGKMAEHLENKFASGWLQRYAGKLITEGIESTLKSLRTMPIKTKAGIKCKQDLIAYFEGNAYRMQYPLYDELGYYIGSGAIESAHRTVVQKRLKLSGQRWTMQGAQRVLNLRVLKMSGKWDIVRNAMRLAA